MSFRQDKIVLAVTSLFAIGALTPHLDAQDPCSNLLTHGIYDYYRDQGQSSSLSEIRHDVCSAYQKYTQDKSSGQVDVSYTVFAAGGSFSAEQIESVGQQMCDLNYSYTTAAALQSRASAVISAAGVQAWQSCVAQYNAGLRVNTDIADDGRAIDVSVYYIPPPGVPSYPTITDVIVNPPEAMACQGSLLAAAQADTTLSGQAAQLACSRVISATPLVQAARKYWALPVSLSIHTTAGSIVRRLSGIPVAAEPASPNIGDIVSSIFPESLFVRLHGPGWVLADGRDVTGTKYAFLGSSKVPDLRGMFLRGMNAGRTDQYADPGGNRVVGSYEDDTTALPKLGFRTTNAGTHNHGGKYVGNGPGMHQTGPHGGPAYDSQPISMDGDHSHILTDGDPETRPKNVAVYFYIRVE